MGQLFWRKNILERKTNSRLHRNIPEEPVPSKFSTPMAKGKVATRCSLTLVFVLYAEGNILRSKHFKFLAQRSMVLLSINEKKMTDREFRRMFKDFS